VTDKKLISSLQGLRAVAFLCVVISHCGAPWLGPWAISVFVALSGFLMVCNYYDRPRTAPGLQSAIAFSFKKIRRLYPLHLIMMAAALLFVLKGLLAQPSARGVFSCAAQLAVSIFLLQTWIPPIECTFFFIGLYFAPIDFIPYMQPCPTVTSIKSSSTYENILEYTFKRPAIGYKITQTVIQISIADNLGTLIICPLIIY